MGNQPICSDRIAQALKRMTCSSHEKASYYTTLLGVKAEYKPHSEYFWGRDGGKGAIKKAWVTVSFFQVSLNPGERMGQRRN